jgi:hypothetical protein
MSVVGPSGSNHGTMKGILHTWIFWQLTRQSLPMRSTTKRQTAGSAPRSQSLDYCTVQSIKRLCTQHNSLGVQLEHGWLPTSPPCLLITRFPGDNSILHFVHITYLRVCSAASWRSSWTLSKGTIVYLTTRGSSILWLNMGHITLIQMRRRPTCTMQGSPSTCRIVWYISPTCRTTSWQVQPLTKKG